MKSLFKLSLLIILINFTEAAVQLNITFPKNDSVIFNNKPVISGSVFQSGISRRLSIDVKIDGKLIGTVPIGLNQSKWSIGVDNALKDGQHTILATAVDFNGQVLATDKSIFEVSKLLTINSPKNNSLAYFPLIIRGNAKPRTILNMQIQNESGKVWGVKSFLIVGSSGKWFFKPDNQILGKNLLTVRARNGVEFVTENVNFTLVGSASSGNGGGCGCN